jgi:hypothetical protein
MQLRNLIEQPERFVRAKFERVRMRLRLSPAVNTGQVAGACHFINNDERAMI